MKIFKHRNTSGKDRCIICGKNRDVPTVLIAQDGTRLDNNEAAIQVCVDCLVLRYAPQGCMIYQMLPLQHTTMGIVSGGKT